MSAVPEKAGAATCGLPPAPEPPTGNASWAVPLCQHSRCFVVAGFFLTFLLVKSNFQMQEWNTSRKSWTQQWQNNLRPPPRSRSKEWYLAVYFPPPLPPVDKHKFPLDDQVSRIFFYFFYSALQALCFIFPIASPEINQSNTCSRPLGLWRRPSTLLAVPGIHSGAVLVESQFYDPGTPASFKQAISEEGEKKQWWLAPPLPSSPPSLPLPLPGPFLRVCFSQHRSLDCGKTSSATHLSPEKPREWFKFVQ